MNILLHLLTAAIVLLIAFKATGDPATALVSAFLFSLHPVQTETVAWISGRNDLLLGLFVTLALLLFAAYRNNPHRQLLFAGSIAAFVLALFTKESAVSYALLFPLYDICFPGPEGNKVNALKKTADYFLIALLVVGYMAIRSSVIGSLISAEQFAGGTTFAERLGHAPGLFAEHLALLIAPFHLSIAHPTGESFWLQPSHQIFCYAVLLAVAGAVWLCWRYDRVALFGLLWMLVGFLLLLNIIPVAVPILEHRLYLPTVGFAIFLSRLIMLLLRRVSNPQVVTAVLEILVITCGIITWNRLSVWQNSETLWQDAIEKAPSYSRSYFNLAGYYFEHQQYNRTVDLMKTYIRLRPDDPAGYLKLRQTYYTTGNYSEAARLTSAMIERNPGNTELYVEAAEFYMRANQLDSALFIYQEGLDVIPNSSVLHDLAGRTYVRLHNEKEAEHHYQEAIELNPEYHAAYFDLGILYTSQGNYQNAIARIEKGMLFGIPPADIVQLLYQLYIKTNQKEKATTLRQRFSQ